MDRNLDVPPRAKPAGSPVARRRSVQFFLDYWNGLRRRRTMPLPSEIDPVHFKYHLPYVFLVEGSMPEDLRIRLAGSFYRELYEVDITGMLVSELIPFTERPDLLVEYQTCLDSHTPVVHEGRVTWRKRGAQLSYERVLLPYGAGNRVCRILGFAEFDLA